MPGISKLILPMTLRSAGLITVTVPPISELTHSCVPAGLNMRDARAAVDQHVVEGLVRRRVDEVGHVGRFGGVDQHLAVGADAHALGLDADGDVGDDLAVVDVDDGDEVVVLVGDVERVAGRMQDRAAPDRARTAASSRARRSWCRRPG